MKKKFSKDLYEKHDATAKAGAMMHLTTRPEVLSCRLNPARYEADVLYTFSPNGTEGMLEAEIKTVWDGGPFKYPDVQVLGRKKKYFIRGCDLILISENLQDYMIIPHNAILGSPIKAVPNRFVPAGEEFFMVPVDKVFFKRFPRPIDVKELYCCGEIELERADKDKFVCKHCSTVHNYMDA